MRSHSDTMPESTFIQRRVHKRFILQGKRGERVKMTAIRYAETGREQCEGEKNKALGGPCLSRAAKFADFVRKIDSRPRRGGRMGAAEWARGVPLHSYFSLLSPFFLFFPFIYLFDLILLFCIFLY